MLKVYPKDNQGNLLPVVIKSWCSDLESQALQQAIDVANHPATFHHVSLMPDAHLGYGMPIGGVAALKGCISSNMVGVDIGCGVIARETNLTLEEMTTEKIKIIMDTVKENIPHGQGKAHSEKQTWSRFEDYLKKTQDQNGVLPIWFNEKMWDLVNRNLGTLGSGNHFIEMQVSEPLGDDPGGKIWLMLHSGSRNLGFQIAKSYGKIALEQNKQWFSDLHVNDLAFLPTDSFVGQAYIEDMNFALEYALENRCRMMESFMGAVAGVFQNAEMDSQINIHHNYAALENHFKKNVWVHRKGATSAKKGEMGIIPGSMGTSSYIVKGLGNRESFMSCSHGAGRTMGRMEYNRTHSVEDADKSMEDIVFHGWSKDRKGNPDYSEAPGAYKDIDTVIANQLDLIEPMVKLRPLGVVKG